MKWAATVIFTVLFLLLFSPVGFLLCGFLMSRGMNLDNGMGIIRFFGRLAVSGNGTSANQNLLSLITGVLTGSGLSLVGTRSYGTGSGIDWHQLWVLFLAVAVLALTWVTSILYFGHTWETGLQQIGRALDGVLQFYLSSAVMVLMILLGLRLPLVHARIGDHEKSNGENGNDT